VIKCGFPNIEDQLCFYVNIATVSRNKITAIHDNWADKMLSLYQQSSKKCMQASFDA